MAIVGKNDGWGSLGRCGTKHREVGGMIARRLRSLLFAAPSFLDSCADVLGESGTLEPDEKYIRFFKGEVLSLLPETTDEPRMLPEISTELDGQH
eukprot:4396667-Amphidinium_carterae.1